MSGERVRVGAVLTQWGVALAVVAADLLSARWAQRSLAHGARHVIGPLWWRLEYNSGISFSLRFFSATATTCLDVIAVVAVLWASTRARDASARLGWSLVAGGGVGNLVDRVMNPTQRVTDFVSVGRFPVFNLADASITIGVAVIIYSLARPRGERA